jgi:hypothetical protein
MGGALGWTLLAVALSSAQSNYTMVTVAYGDRIRLTYETVDDNITPHFHPINYTLNYWNSSHIFVTRWNARVDKLFGKYAPIIDGHQLDFNIGTILVGTRDCCNLPYPSTLVAQVRGSRLVYMHPAGGHRICINMHCNIYHFDAQQTIRIDPVVTSVYVLTTR